MGIAVRLVATLLGLGLAGGQPGPATAATFHDTRPCVTNHELWTTPGGFSRLELERRWEVVSKGRRYADALIGRGWAYPICDRPMSERFAVAQFQPGYGLVGVGEVRPGTD